MPGSERRRFRRVPVHLNALLTPVNIHLAPCIGEESVSGCVVDVSPTGMLIHLDSSYRIGTRFKIDIAIAERLLPFYVVVRRIAAPDDESGGQIPHGVQLIGASQEAVQTLATAVLGYTFRTPRDRAA